jgi:hypothetical protein
MPNANLVKISDEGSIMKGLVLCDGPKRLPFVILLKRRDTSHKARVLDRNQPGDAFGGGAVKGSIGQRAVRRGWYIV